MVLADGTTTVHQSQERQTDAEKPLPKDGSGHQHTLSAANSDDLAPDGTTAMSARKGESNIEQQSL